MQLLRERWESIAGLAVEGGRNPGKPLAELRLIHFARREEIVIDGTRFALFISAAVILALTPGPGILYVLGRTLHGGRREGVLSAIGTFVGGSTHVLAAALGLSAILMTSAIAFEVVRYAGAAYLVYLGISMIRNRHAAPIARNDAVTSKQNFMQGILTEVLNPKTALFFLSFIPQFVVPAHGHVTIQFLILGAISVSLNTAVDLMVVGFASSIAAKLSASPKLIENQRTASGVGMIGLGVYVAASK
jgi:threonine/homoserine/homoserine lactone efflux protein